MASVPLDSLSDARCRAALWLLQQLRQDARDGIAVSIVPFDHPLCVVALDLSRAEMVTLRATFSDDEPVVEVALRNAPSK